MEGTIVTLVTTNANPLWNSLVITQLAVSALTPVIIMALGVYIHRVTKHFEHKQWQSQKLIEKRIQIYDELAPLFNNLLCYYTYVGYWKEPAPEDIVKLKRTIDKKVHLAQPLFSSDFFTICNKMQDLCYETHNGWGEDATLKTAFDRRRDAAGANWREACEHCFSKTISNIADIKDTYRQLMEVFAKNIGARP